jgi:hypothetical protein
MGVPSILKLIPYRSNMGRKHPQPLWWNDECTAAQQYREKCREKCIGISSGPKYEKLREARRQAKRVFAMAKQAVGWIPEHKRHQNTETAPEQ